MIRSYRSAFILVFTALMVVTVASVGLNAYRRASQISLDLSADIIGEMSEKIVNRTERIFEGARSILETDAVLFSTQGPDLTRDQVFHLFWRQLQLQPQLQSIFAADAAGSFLQVREQPRPVTRFIDRSKAQPLERLIYRDKGYRPIAHINGGGLYDPRNADWHQGAIAARGELYWSPLYRFSGTGQLGFTAAKAVYQRDETLRAGVGVDITLRSLSEFLAEQRGIRNGVALIVDRHDNLVAFPYHLRLREPAAGEATGELGKVDQLAHRWLIDAYQALKKREGPEANGMRSFEGESGTGLSGRTDYAFIRSRGVGYIAHSRPIPAAWSDGWRLLVVVPDVSLLRTASRVLSESAVISLIVLIAAVFLVSLLAFRLFAPMRRLEENTELVTQLRLDEVRPVNSRFREIQAMDRAICSMRQGLQSLSKFVPADIARDLIQSGKEAKLGAESADVTLFFSAPAEFSRLCVTLPPERIVAALSHLLDRFTRIVLWHGGTIDNYLGESIMAFWGAPLPVDDGPEQACRAALGCIDAENDLRREEPEGYPPGTRNLFAIHAGRAIVGNIGSETRMNYTAIGDSVELGWILKHLNRRYGTRIILSESARSAVADHFWFRRLDVIRPPGGGQGEDARRSRGGEIAIYELLGECSRPLAWETQAFVRRYEQGLSAIRAGKWETAQPLFEGLAEEYPDDKSVHLMAMRCRARDPCLCPRAQGADMDIGDALPDGF